MKEVFGKNNECAVVDLKVDGFDALTLKQKHLVYYLTMAGLYGNSVYLNQRNEYNLLIIAFFYFFIILVKDHDAESVELISNLEDYLNEVLFHNGIFNSYNNKKIEPKFTLDEINNAYSKLPKHIANFYAFGKNKDLIMSILFGEKMKGLLQTSHSGDKDNLAVSSLGFYQGGITQKEMTEYFNGHYKKEDESPMYGINSFFKKDENGKIVEKRICENEIDMKDFGYNDFIKGVIGNLKKACEYAENKAQLKSIETLIKFYQTGNPKDFDEHCIAWLEDRESDIFFINGFIETYLDPMGRVGSFESIVAFKNPEKTKIVNKIIDNIQYFEDNLPVNPDFKKEKAVGLSASSITVVSASGEAYPVLPLGICLPNSDWIRAKFGSKSVNLDNVAGSRDDARKGLINEFFLDDYFEDLKKYKEVSNSLHTDLHEIAGHGSGQNLSGVSNNDLGSYYSVIEETRADLVALYYMFDENLKKFGIVSGDIDMEEFAKAQYIYYFTNGLMLQLNRVDMGDSLAQTHMRNRQLITKYLLKNCDDLETVVKDGKSFIKINSIVGVRKALGDLLGIIQKIKSTGDIELAGELINDYGTNVDSNLHKDVLDRYKKLKIPSYVGFSMPLIKPIKKDGEIVDFELTWFDNFQDEACKIKYPQLLEEVSEDE